MDRAHMNNPASRKGVVGDVGVILFAAVIGHALLLLNPNGLYGEDWKLFSQSPEALREIFSGGYVLWEGWAAGVLATYCDLRWWKAISLALFTLSGIMLYCSLRRISLIGRLERVLIPLMYVSLPIYAAKAYTLLTLRSLFLLCFFSGAFLFIKSIADRSVVWRLGALFLFSLSISGFLGLLPLYYVVAVAAILVMRPEPAHMGGTRLVKAVVRYPDFMVVPLGVFLWHRLFVVVENTAYTGSEYTIQSPFVALLNTLDHVLHTIVGVFDPLYLVSTQWPLVFLFCCLVFAFYLVIPKAWRPAGDAGDAGSLWGIGFGLAAMLSAAVPYLVTSRAILFTGYQTRNQYLLPLGMAFLVVYGVKRMASRTLYLPLLLGLLCMFFMVNNLTWSQFYRDWVKQRAFVAAVTRNETVRNNGTFVVWDRCKSNNAVSRNVSFFDYHVPTAHAMDDGKPRLFETFDSKNVNIALYQGLPWVSLDGYEAGEAHIVEIRNERPLSLRNGDLFRVMYAEWTDPELFESLARSHYPVEVYPPSEIAERLR